MLQYGKKGEICNLDIGTNKENMATVKWPRLSGFYWLRGGSGEKVFCFCEDWQSPRISLCACVCGGGTKGQAESRSSVVFSRNQKPSFPLQANLEKKCPTWRQGLSSCWGRPEVDLGNVFEWRPVGVPLKPERWTEEMRACPHKREGDCVHSVAKITSVPEQPRHTHTRMSGHTECHV